MAILPPGEHAARLIEHYLRELTRATGRRWTEQNSQDMVLLGDLLDQADAGADTIPPFGTSEKRFSEVDPPQLDTRVTQVIDQDTEGWADFRRWQAQRAEDEQIAQARRIVSRR